MTKLPPAGRAIRVHRAGHAPVAFPVDPAFTYDFGRVRRAHVLYADGRVSRLHGRLEAVGRRWLFTDPGSANGSFRFRVDDWLDCEAIGARLPCARLAVGRPEWIRPGEGVLLGSRGAWFELLLEVPVGSVLDPARINPPEVLDALGLGAPTHDLAEDHDLTARRAG